ncbi:hypothetical protein ACPW7J_04835 [Ihubacter sp. rT4E-8]|uniref:hypothetical protein n=1 Tax=Ihubacter sp. rT4E-8 TaxID=3242369 RepID=UPI00137ACB32
MRNRTKNEKFVIAFIITAAVSIFVYGILFFVMCSRFPFSQLNFAQRQILRQWAERIINLGAAVYVIGNIWSIFCFIKGDRQVGLRSLTAYATVAAAAMLVAIIPFVILDGTNRDDYCYPVWLFLICDVAFLTAAFFFDLRKRWRK